MRSFAFGLVALFVAVPAVAGSPPAQIDLVLSLRVASSSYADLRPGATGVLEFTVESRLPGFAGFPFRVLTLDFLMPEPLPVGDMQPIRLQAIAGDLCTLRTDTTYLGEPGLSYRLEGLVPGSTMEKCHVAFEVLPAATARQYLRFNLSANSGASFGYVDLTPEDNVVDFAFGGTPPVPLPSGGRVGWLLMALLLTGAAVRMRKRMRRVA